MWKVIEDLIAERYPEGVLRSLERQFPDVSDLVEDAVAEAFVKLATRNTHLEPVVDPRKWVYAVARNELRRESRRIGIELEDDNLPSLPAAEEEAMRGELYRTLKAVVDRWENETLRIVTSVFLNAAHEGEPLTLEEAAEMVAGIRGEEISVSTVFRKRQQGFERLLTEIRRMEFAGDIPTEKERVR